MLKLALFLFARLREPSTHAGLSALLLALAQLIPAYGVVFNAAAIVLGGGAMAIPERGSSTSP
jgi:hypothetical protein